MHTSCVAPALARGVHLGFSEVDMDDTWVLVVDGGKGRLFQTDGEMAELTPLRRWTNEHEPAEHRRRGRDPDSDHDEEEERFAREVTRDLDLAETHNSFRTLVLVAPPRFLGFINKHLGAQSTKRVSARIGKDIVEEEVHMLAKHLRKLLADKHLEGAR